MRGQIFVLRRHRRARHGYRPGYVADSGAALWFPETGSNTKGEWVYSAEQVRRLLDLGLRPGKVGPLNDEVFGKLAGTLPRSSLSPQANPPALARPIALASSGDITALTAALEQAIDRDGLCAFVLNTFAPLPTTLGALWAGRQPQIFEVHLLTRHLVRSLDVAMSRVGRPAGDPEVLLATLPGERHALGLLMLEALLMPRGQGDSRFGAEVPVDRIVAAVERSGVKTVALSFNAYYACCLIRDDIDELVDRLPSGVALWIGDAGMQQVPPSVQRMSLDEH